MQSAAGNAPDFFFMIDPFKTDYVNRGMVAPPSFHWTWDEFRDFGIEVRQAMDAQGMNNSWMTRCILVDLNQFAIFLLPVCKTSLGIAS